MIAGRGASLWKTLLGLASVALCAALLRWPSPGRAEPPERSETKGRARSDWPVFRGNPALTGAAEFGLPAEFELRWSCDTGSEILSSPVIAGNRLFVSTCGGEILALSLQEGRKLWSFRCDDAFEASPLVWKGCVYVGSTAGNFYACDAMNGALLWTYRAEGQISGSANVAESAEGRARILVGGYDHAMHCLDAATGKALWTCPTEGPINGSAAVFGDFAAFGGCDGKLRIVSHIDGALAASFDLLSYIPASPAFDGGCAFVGHYGKELLCIDTKRTEIAWRHRTNAPVSSSPALSENSVVAGLRSGGVICVSRRDGSLLWRFPLRGKAESSPVVCRDRVVVGSEEGRIHILDLASGREVWSYETGAAIPGSPAVTEGMIAVADREGRVWAFAERERR